MENISFSKMSGAGNDFIIIDKNSNPSFVLSQNAIKNLCSRRTGIGADGLITIEDSDELDFNMNYFNADGSTGSLCGNGARCAVYAAELSGRIKNKRTDFYSNGARYSAEVIAGEVVKFNLNNPVDLKLNFTIQPDGVPVKASFINTGSPHVVIDIKDLNTVRELNEIPVFNLGRSIRYLNDFKPGGTNVNFIERRKDEIAIRTYERGVEDETLACGTGSVAAAVIAFINYHIQPPIKIKTFGGDELIVNFKIKEESVEELSLTGPAKQIFTGTFSLNKFL